MFFRNLVSLVLCTLVFQGALLIASLTIESDENQVSSTQQILPSVVDEIKLKQQEMRNTIVLIQTRKRSGSGTIINRLQTDVEEVFEYHILTNTHITHGRFITHPEKVNSLTGEVKTTIVDTGCKITTFSYQQNNWNLYSAEVIGENIPLDLAILSFLSTKKLAVAKIADDEMLSQVRVFDEVFAIGCQFKQIPSPTVGIVSQILMGYYGKTKWIIYGNTAQVTPGSSGGGLFKKYDDHYYLIGIPYRVEVTSTDQFIPHLAQAISLATAMDFIENNCVSR